MKGSLIIVGFFVLGALCGVYHLIPYDFTQSKLSFYALCALMFSVGVSVGNDPQTLRNFRSLNPRLIFLPVIIRKTKCFDFWERNVLFPKTKRSFFRTPTLPFSA